jgi:hypothetical protein
MSRNEGYIIEYYQLGTSVKVSAIDPVTLKEVSIVGDARAGNDELAKLAVRKLKYILGKEPDVS